MTEEKRPADAHSARVGPAKPKKPYRKPEFRYEKVFETMALACGKITGTQFQCRGRPRRS
jgi:hypothetical protein